MERIVKLFKRERGFTLIEVVIALAVFAVISVAFFVALITAQKALLLSKERAIAESLARSQMEIVKESLFAGFYASSIDPEYSDKGYTANIDADLIALGLQKITVTVYINGEEVWELEGYKSDR